MGGLEERIERLERVLGEVLRRLEVLEELVRGSGADPQLLNIAAGLVAAFSTPAIAALEASRRVLSALRVLGGADEITRAVIEVLSMCEELSISEVTRRVRVLRGTASRRIVRERIERLVKRGVVRRGSRGVVLALCEERGVGQES